MQSFLEMLAEHAGEKSNAPRMSKIGQVARLREFAVQYEAPNAFEVGDLVTPRAGGQVKDAGEPHIVVETRTTPIHHFEGHSIASSFGMRLNIRVAMISDAGPVCFWGEHHAYELYTGDGSRPGDLVVAQAA